MIVSHSNIHTLFTPTNKMWTLVGKCGYLMYIHFVSDVHECEYWERETIIFPLVIPSTNNNNNNNNNNVAC